MIKAGVVGGTGYAGVELLRLLAAHSQVELSVITSRSEAGVAVADLFPNLRGHLDLDFSAPDPERLQACDVVFFATPHGVAMSEAGALLAAGTKVIDLGADFRIKDIPLWERWYGMPHTSPELVEEAVYGLPEINRDAVRGARLVACPGCYPTAVTLGFLPLIEHGLLDPGHLVADAKSGVSGAGRKATIPLLQAEVDGNFKAYAASGHRHLPEIRQNLSLVANQPVELTFVPHLIPAVRGIHATLYGRLRDHADLQALYEQRFRNEPFVDVLPEGAHPETRTVRGINICRLAVHRAEGSDTVVILSVVDNLVKGAAGQAVQNMNIMFGLPETSGLEAAAVLP